jgi:hypothetical protein
MGMQEIVGPLLGDTLGREIVDVDLSKPLSQEILGAIQAAFCDNLVLSIFHMDTCTAILPGDRSMNVDTAATSTMRRWPTGHHITRWSPVTEDRLPGVGNA